MYIKHSIKKRSKNFKPLRSINPKIINVQKKINFVTGVYKYAFF